MVVPMDPQEEGQRWLAFAREDLRIAELALQETIFNQTCFHAQQCVEKCLKALIAAAGELLPRTHLLSDLLGHLPLASRSSLAPLEEQVLSLDQFYIPTRYPDALPGSLPQGLPQREHAQVALVTARTCLEQVTKMLR
jgi:HEPN domain-containing protein